MNSKKEKFKKLVLDEEEIKDVKNIATGVYHPLSGFLREKDFKGVVSKMRLANKKIWSIPVVLDIDEKKFKELKNEKNILLTNSKNKPVALLKDVEMYGYEREIWAKNVFGTLDKNHPGVKDIYERGSYLVGGDIELLDHSREPFKEYNLTPVQTKKIFKDKGWKTIVAFQTRNVPHRSHEALQKIALKLVDGLLVQPVIGKKKPGDFKDEVIIECYQVLLKKHYPRGKSFFAILPMKMNYAGPREAVMHALIRRNYGCTHMIIGRNHAGVGDYYDSYAAHRIFDQFKKEELGIEILKYENISYCYKCKDFVLDNLCPHKPEDKFQISGTKMRGMIQNKEKLPKELLRPDIEEIIIKYENPFVD